MMISPDETLSSISITPAHSFRSIKDLTPTLLKDTAASIKKYLSEGFSLTTSIEFTRVEFGVSHTIINKALAEHQKKAGNDRYQELKRGHVTLSEDAYDTARQYEKVKKERAAAAAGGQVAPGSAYTIAEEIAMSVRLSKIFQMKYIDSREFYKKNAEAVILAEMPQAEKKQRTVKPDKSLPAYIARLYDNALLTPLQEKHLFRKYNYIKSQIVSESRKLNPENPNDKLLKKLEDMHESALAVKNKILVANLRLAVNVAKRFTSYDAADDMFDRISDMNVSLARAIDGFDYSKGFRFSTYAMNAIKKNYIRTNQASDKYRTRFSNAASEVVDDAVARPAAEPRYQHDEYQRIEKVLQHLDAREVKIIEMRMGLNGYAKKYTLKEVGEEFGLTRERIRQIEADALEKIRQESFRKNQEPEITREEMMREYDSRTALYNKLETMSSNAYKIVRLLWHSGQNNEAEIKTSLLNGQNSGTTESGVRQMLSYLRKRGFIELSTGADGTSVYKLTADACRLLDLINKNAA